MSLALLTFPNNELNHSLTQKRIRKSILSKRGQKSTLNVKLHSAHSGKSPPDKATGVRVQGLRTMARERQPQGEAGSQLIQPETTPRPPWGPIWPQGQKDVL